ncbi:hypothetical protein OJF2_02870 [Aquisphaera giovannonii]|uniref:Uncharacterized protein n=1 Tax=Aquisphaera giovannonii TaxID=406548 RepID=A0A5B9VU21_9BACT|nr:LEPR-XLL domain-containing protein [Aquisphaera giovannonii]QEH31822.1 hypothetical protein OJF2_02870 [Aquisphaera giovannonii]
MKHHRLRPGFEALEGKLLLSAAGIAAAPGATAAVARAGAKAQLHVPNFTLIIPGYFGPRSPSSQHPLGVPWNYSVQFSKPFQRKGRVDIGNFRSSQLVPAAGDSPDFSGMTVTLTSSKGSVTATLSDSTSKSYRFSITSADGQLATELGRSGSVAASKRRLGTSGPGKLHADNLKFTFDRAAS